MKHLEKFDSLVHGECCLLQDVGESGFSESCVQRCDRSERHFTAPFFERHVPPFLAELDKAGAL
jgi:hypothetical protein